MSAEGAGMAEVEFGIVYDGPAVADGSMPVRELAPALLALGELFAEASHLIEPERPPVSLNIQATGEGSFLVDLVLQAPGVWNQVVDLLTSRHSNALVNLLAYIGGAHGVFAVTQWLKGRSAKSQEEISPGWIRLTQEDGTTFDAPAAVVRLMGSVEVRRQAAEVVAPLRHEGIREVRITDRKSTLVSITETDAKSFDLPEGPVEELGESERDVVLEIVSVAFVPGNKWRFREGADSGVFHAAIEDRSYFDEVAGGREAFRSGDLLRVTLRQVQSRTSSGLRSESIVVKVHEHIPRATQMRLGEEPPEL